MDTDLRSSRGREVDGGNGHTSWTNTASLRCTFIGKTEPEKHCLKWT